MAIVLARETGFVMTEQMPCLNLNTRSINPENDLWACLYKPRHEEGNKCHKGRKAQYGERREQFGSTCGKGLRAI